VGSFYDHFASKEELHESVLAGGPGSGRAWQQLAADTGALREHLEYLRDRGEELPGDPALVAAAMGAMLGTLAYAILPSGSSGFTDDEVIDTLTRLLEGGAGRAGARHGYPLKAQALAVGGRRPYRASDQFR
jgi:AcrR family transcriptional regulator